MSIGPLLRWRSSRTACAEGRIGVTPEALRQWADTLDPDDEVAFEATGNSDAIAMLLAPLVRRVVISNPRKTRAIAEAKVRTDKVDARILAQLLAADFLPPVWLPDDRTRMLRRQIARRTHLVRQRTRLKNQVHAILARNLAPTCPLSDLFGKAGRPVPFGRARIGRVVRRLTRRPRRCLAWRERERARGDRASVLMLVPAGVLIVLVMASIAVDMSLVQLRQRQATT
jgi:transposase